MSANEICGRIIERCIELRCADAPYAEGMCEAHYAQVLKLRNSTVYFIAAGQYVKIGHSTNLDLRRINIRAAASITTPSDLTAEELADHKVLATETGGPDRESRLHYHFRDYWAAGEWFRRSPEIMRYIEALTRPNNSVSRELISRYDSGQYLIDAAIAAQTLALLAKRDRTSACKARSDAVRAAHAAGIRTKTLARSLGIQSQRVIRMVAGRE